MITNPFSKLLNAHPHLCCILGTVSSSNLDYANPFFWVSKHFYSLATTGVCK